MSQELVVKLVMPSINFAALSSDLVTYSGWIFLILLASQAVAIPLLRYGKIGEEFNEGLTIMALPWLIVFATFCKVTKIQTLSLERVEELEEIEEQYNDLWEVNDE